MKLLEGHVDTPRRLEPLRIRVPGNSRSQGPFYPPMCIKQISRIINSPILRTL